MKKQHTLALLLLAGLALASCSSDDDAVAEQPTPQTPTEVKTYQATTTLGKGLETRTLSESGDEINAGWASGEEVYVIAYYDSNHPEYGTYSTGFMSPTSISGATATLSGELTGSFCVNDPVTLRFPRAERKYTNQPGTLPGIAASFDYAELVTTVNAVNGSNITIEGGTMVNKQCIVKFDFGSTAISALTITSSALESDVSVTGANSTVIYVAMPIAKSVSATYRLVATPASGTAKRCDKTYTLENGKFYTANLNITSWSDVPSIENIGKVYYDDGTIGAPGIAGKTAVGIFACVTKKGEALVMALDDYEVNDNPVTGAWGPTDVDTDIPNVTWETMYMEDGSANTDMLRGISSYPIFYNLPTDWFIPSIGELVQAFDALAEKGKGSALTDAEKLEEHIGTGPIGGFNPLNANTATYFKYIEDALNGTGCTLSTTSIWSSSEMLSSDASYLQINKTDNIFYVNPLGKGTSCKVRLFHKL